LLHKGKILENRYKILDTIKIGSRGAVYSAMDLHLPDKNWIIKEIFSADEDNEDQPDIIKEMRNKAGKLAQLEYISLPRLIDFFILEKNSYLIFDYIEGKNIKDLLNTREYFTESIAKNYIYQMANTCNYIEKKEKDIFFIDIKPENILITSNEILKFVDFGLLKTSGNSRRIFYSKFFDSIKFDINLKDDFVVLGIMFYYLLTGNMTFPFCYSSSNISEASKEIIIKSLNGKYLSWESFIKDIYSHDKEISATKGSEVPSKKEDILYPEDEKKETVREKIINKKLLITQKSEENTGREEKQEEFLPLECSHNTFNNKKFPLKPSLIKLLSFSILMVIVITLARLIFPSNMEDFSNTPVDEPVSVSPLQPEVMKDRGLYYYSLEDYSRASNFLKRHILKYPDDGEAHLYLSNSQVLQVEDNVIYTGLAIPLSGKDSQTGLAITQGVALAVKEINNAGGIDGKKIVFVIKDNNLKTVATEDIARDFIEDKEILAVIGYTLSGAKAYNEGKLPCIVPVPPGSEIMKAGNYIFTLCPDKIIQGEVLASIAKNNLKANKIVTMTDLYDPYFTDLTNSFKAALNIKIIFEGTYKSGDTDYAGEIKSIIKFSPDLIFISGYDREGLLIIKQLRDYGFKGNILGGDTFYSQKMLNAGQDYLNGTICTTFFYLDLSKKEVKDFITAFGKLFGGITPDPVAAQAYDATKLLAFVMLNDKMNSREDLRRKLLETGDSLQPYKGITGEISFKKKDKAVREWVVVKIQNGKYVTL